MTPNSRQRHTGHTAPASAPVVVPSTLWAAGSTPVDPGQRWPAPILSRAVGEFSAPGARVLLIGWPAPTARGGLRVAEPDTAAALASVAGLGRRGETGPGAGEAADLVVVSLLAEHGDPITAADEVAALAVERLAAGGLLVVLSRCRHSRDGVLADPAVAVVAAAQAADLLYLQHIIAVPVTGDTVTPGPADSPRLGPVRHAVAHTDVFVFLQPRSAAALAQE